MDDYLLQGIHGAKETKPDERRRFLTTIRERVVVALTGEQVMEKGIYPKVEILMKENGSAHLFLNGHLDYSNLSKYISIAKSLNLEYTIVTNKDYNSDLGLVLAQEFAIDKEEIFIGKEPETEPVLPTKPEEKGFMSIFQNIFKK
ncbi:MAG: hypothetical protein K0S25_785 [Bacillus sp. (in: firmicutes)]|jgi:uncharacterized protein YueI|nr:hypothetical protein [Bacillus sp. (in: firmicutes)]